MPVEEVFVINETVGVAQLQDLIVSRGVNQLAQPGLGNLLQHLPEDVVAHPAHVEADPLVQLPRLLDNEGVWGTDFRQERSH